MREIYIKRLRSNSLYDLSFRCQSAIVDQMTDDDISKLVVQLSEIMITKDDLKSLATKDDLETLATKDDLEELRKELKNVENRLEKKIDDLDKKTDVILRRRS